MPTWLQRRRFREAAISELLGVIIALACVENIVLHADLMVLFEIVEWRKYNFHASERKPWHSHSITGKKFDITHQLFYGLQQMKRDRSGLLLKAVL